MFALLIKICLRLSTLIVTSAVALFCTHDLVNYGFQRAEGTPVEAVVIGKTDNHNDDTAAKAWKVTVSILDSSKKRAMAHEIDVNAGAYLQLAVGEKVTVLLPKRPVQLENATGIDEVFLYLFRGRPTLRDFFLLEASRTPLYFLILLANVVGILIYHRFFYRRDIKS